MHPLAYGLASWCTIGLVYYASYLRNIWNRYNKITVAQLLTIFGFLLSGGCLVLAKVFISLADAAHGDALSTTVFSRKSDKTQKKIA